MNSSLLEETKTRLDEIANAVLERGWDSSVVGWDDYSVLLERFEFRKLVIFQLYESYFLPKRHEFELQIITEIVDSVSKPAAFLGAAALGGIVGNAVYEALKHLLLHLISKFRQNGNLSEPYAEIAQNLDKIHQFFNQNEQATIDQIRSELGIQPHKAEPLLKLLQCKCKRRGKHLIWMRPNPSALSLK
jgi:hypothetical protein